MPEHSALTGASLHEPKGVATAASGEVYIADGSGSGAWTALNTDYSTSVHNTQTGTTYTLVLTDAGKTVEMNNAAANTLTIPTNAADTWLNIIQWGAGTTTISAASGVTLNGVSAGSCTIDAQYAGVSIRKRGTNDWGIVGAHSTVA